MNKNKQELRNLSASELNQRIDDLRRELFGIRLQAITSPSKDNSQFKKLRREIARVLTISNSKGTVSDRK